MFQFIRKMKKKTKKKGQATVELIFVLGLYLFLIGFMITGFQLMYNKMVYSLAAYEGVRTSIAYNPTVPGKYDIAQGRQAVNNVLAMQIGDTIDQVNVVIDSSGQDYITCTVSADVKFLFPIINPNNLSSKNNSIISSSFTMRKEKPQGS